MLSLRITNAKIEVAAGKTVKAKTIDQAHGGRITAGLPILNKGIFDIPSGIHVTVDGQLEVGGPSFKSESGSLTIAGGTNIDAQYGMSITGGTLNLSPTEMNARVGIRIREAGSTFTFTGGLITFDTFAIPPEQSITTKFWIQGNVQWDGGIYSPVVSLQNQNEVTQWESTGTFTIGDNAKIEPRTRTLGGAEPATAWTIIVANDGIVGSTEDHLNAVDQTVYEILEGSKGKKKWWVLHETN